MSWSSPARRRAADKTTSIPWRTAAARGEALEDHEDPVGAGAGRPLGVQVGGHRGEEPARHRDQPLPAALALGDKPRRSAARRSSSRSPRTSQQRSPPSTIAATMARSRRVRCVAISASTSAGDKIRGKVRVTRTSGTPWPGRDRSCRVGSPRHRIGGHVPAGPQEREEPRHDRQPPPHRRGRHPARLGPCLQRLQRAALAGTAGALRGDERQHIGRPDLIRRRLGGRGEEHLQVTGRL